MGPIDLVVFDLAGTTIADDGGQVLRCLMAAAERFDLPASEGELNDLMGLNKREVFGIFAARKVPDDAAEAGALADAALDAFTADILAHYENNIVPLPGVEDTFRYLRSRNIKIATDTGFGSRILAAIMTRLDWPGRLIDCAVCVDDVPQGRPAPYMIFHAMEQLGATDVRRVVKIGDSPADLEEGMNAGCGEVIGVLSGTHGAASLGRFLHTRILQSAADLPLLLEEQQS